MQISIGKTGVNSKAFAATVLGLFSAVLALKDIAFKGMSLNGAGTSEILFFSGIGALTSAGLVALLTSAPIRPCHPKYQVLRLFISAATWGLIAQSFHYLSATSIAIVSKIHVPLLIVLGAWFGVSYSKAQKSIAALAVLSLIYFLIYGRQSSEPLFGYGLVFLAVVFVIAEYVMLRDSAKDEPLFIVAAVPALACILMGIPFLGQGSVALSGEWLAVAFGTGGLVYAIYALSIYRYQILPLGISEYPSVVSAVFVLILENRLYGFVPPGRYLASLLLLLVLIALTLALKRPLPAVAR